MRWIQHMCVAAFDCARVQTLLCCFFFCFICSSRMNSNHPRVPCVCSVVAYVSLSCNLCDFVWPWKSRTFLCCGFSVDMQRCRLRCDISSCEEYYQATMLTTDRNLCGSACMRLLSLPSYIQGLSQTTGTLQIRFFSKWNYAHWGQILQSCFLVLHHIYDISITNTGKLHLEARYRPGSIHGELRHFCGSWWECNGFQLVWLHGLGDVFHHFNLCLCPALSSVIEYERTLPFPSLLDRQWQRPPRGGSLWKDGCSSPSAWFRSVVFPLFLFFTF